MSRRFLPFSLVLLIGIAGCDTQGFDQGSEVDPIAAAEEWYGDQVSPESIARKFAGNGIDPQKLLAKYYPDWSRGRVVTVPGHANVVMAVLGPDATKTFGKTQSIVRALLITLDSAGDPVSGEVIDFVGYDSGASMDPEELAVGHLTGDYGDQVITAARYDVLYQPVGAQHFSPTAPPMNLDISARECTKEEVDGDSSSKSAAVTYLCYESGQGTECHYWTEGGVEHTECWIIEIILTCVEAEDGGEGGEGGSGGTGGAGGGSTGGPLTSLDVRFLPNTAVCVQDVTNRLIGAQHELTTELNAFAGYEHWPSEWDLNIGSWNQAPVPTAQGMRYTAGLHTGSEGFSDIYINTHFASNIREISIAKTLLHEGIHAYLYQYIDSFGGMAGLSSAFPAMYSVWAQMTHANGTGQPQPLTAQQNDVWGHTFLEQHYVDRLYEALKDYNTSETLGVPDDHLLALAWSGLQSSQTFAANSPYTASHVANVSWAYATGQPHNGITPAGSPVGC